MSLKHPVVKSFSYAIQGIKLALKNEPNFRIHIIIAAVAIILGLFLGLNFVEMALLTLTIGFVLVLELINTTLEAVVNLVSPNIRPQAKIAKDVSAAAVLMASILAVIIGVFLFLPRLVLIL